MTYQSAILADNPVGFWPLNETSGTVATDLGSGANNGTYAGTPTLGKTGLVFEAGGVCPDFDGVDDVASMGDVLDMGTGDMALEGWFTTPATFANTAMVGKGKSGSDVGRYAAAYDATGKFYVLWHSTADGFNAFTSPNTLAASTKYYFAVNFNRDGNISIWIDAVLDSEFDISASSAENLNNISPFRIGAFTQSDNSGVEALHDGKIQYVALYTSLLTPLQIRKHYRAGLATGLHKEILDLGPTFYAPLNEASGAALDWSGNDNNGTPAGDITQGAAGLLGYDTSTGYTFGGSNGEIPISHPASTTTYSLFAVLSIDSATGEYKILEDGGVGHWSIKDGKQNLNYSASDHLGTATLGTTTLVTVGISVNAGAGTFYTNGASDGSAASVIALDFETLSDAAASFDGHLQCVARFDTALTAANHRTLAMAARTLIEDRGYPKVIANLTPSFYARLGEASGTTVYDESGNGNDGTINGSPVLATNDGPLHQSRLKAMSFDGVDDYVQTTYAGQTGSQARTLMCWFKMPATTGAKRVIASYGTNTANQLFEVHVDTAGNFGVDCNTCSALGDTVLSAATLYFGAVVLSGTTANDFAVYINGAVETETYTGGTNTINTVAGTNMRIGVSITGSNYAGMDGAEVMEINSALTAQQIKQIYEAGRSRFAAEVISKQPRNAYRYNEASGNLIDYGALGNDGTWTGTPTYQQAPSVITNEPNDYAMTVTTGEEVAITSDIAGTTYSLMMIAKPTAVSGTQKLFDDGAADGFRLNGAKMSLFYSATEHDSDTTLIAGAAHMFAVSVNAGAVTYNLDGGADGTATSAPLINPDVLLDSSFAGDVGEAAIFNTALTDADWLDIYEMASYSLTTFFGLQGNLSESLTATDFVISAFDKATHALIATATIDTVADPTGAYQIAMDQAQGAFYYTAQADIGTEYVNGAVYAVDDYVYPTDVESDTDPHFYQVTTGGTAGSEPAWNKAGGTSTSNGVVFQDMGEIPTPVTHGPLNPVAS